MVHFSRGIKVASMCMLIEVASWFSLPRVPIEIPVILARRDQPHQDLSLNFTFDNVYADAILPWEIRCLFSSG